MEPAGFPGITLSSRAKYPGIKIDDRLSWIPYICCKKLNPIKQIKRTYYSDTTQTDLFSMFEKPT